MFWQELWGFFGEEEPEGLKKEPGSYLKTTEKKHGGIAVKEYYQTEDVDWYAKKDKWKNLKSFGAVRLHWGAGNKLHWHLDFTFRDDK